MVLYTKMPYRTFYIYNDVSIWRENEIIHSTVPLYSFTAGQYIEGNGQSETHTNVG